MKNNVSKWFVILSFYIGIGCFATHAVAHGTEAHTDPLTEAMQAGNLKLEQKLNTVIDQERNLSVLRVELAPTYKEPEHTHPGEEVLYIVSGAGNLWLNGVPNSFATGDILHVAEGKRKALQNTSVQESLVVIAYLVVDNNKPSITLHP